MNSGTKRISGADSVLEKIVLAAVLLLTTQKVNRTPNEMSQTHPEVPPSFSLGRSFFFPLFRRRIRRAVHHAVQIAALGNDYSRRKLFVSKPVVKLDYRSRADSSDTLKSCANAHDNSITNASYHRVFSRRSCEALAQVERASERRLKKKNVFASFGVSLLPVSSSRPLLHSTERIWRLSRLADPPTKEQFRTGAVKIHYYVLFCEVNAHSVHVDVIERSF